MNGRISVCVCVGGGGFRNAIPTAFLIPPAFRLCYQGSLDAPAGTGGQIHTSTRARQAGVCGSRWGCAIPAAVWRHGWISHAHLVKGMREFSYSCEMAATSPQACSQ